MIDTRKSIRQKAFRKNAETSNSAKPCFAIIKRGAVCKSYTDANEDQLFHFLPSHHAWAASRQTGRMMYIESQMLNSFTKCFLSHISSCSTIIIASRTHSRKSTSNSHSPEGKWNGLGLWSTSLLSNQAPDGAKYVCLWQCTNDCADLICKTFDAH